VITDNDKMIGETIFKMFESKYRNIVWYFHNLGNFIVYSLISIYRTVLAIMKLHRIIKMIEFLNFIKKIEKPIIYLNLNYIHP
jgi:hypothetical protein